MTDQTMKAAPILEISATRAAFYGSALGNGWMTINEVRRLENLEPVPGDVLPRMKMQNVPIDGSGSGGGPT